ncbi:hypothetical protein JST56_02430 [Candidatus Dependentiae bacterium]|jgi:hypothetical protein|nr:hypothetical protein [Candidatus Dependentiae bacterium]
MNIKLLAATALLLSCAQLNVNAHPEYERLMSKLKAMYRDNKTDIECHAKVAELCELTQNDTEAHQEFFSDILDIDSIEKNQKLSHQEKTHAINFRINFLNWLERINTMKRVHALKRVVDLNLNDYLKTTTLTPVNLEQLEERVLVAQEDAIINELIALFGSDTIEFSVSDEEDFLYDSSDEEIQ